MKEYRMKMVSTSWLASLFVLAGVSGCFAQAEDATILPELVDKKHPIVNDNGLDPTPGLECGWLSNRDAIFEILKRDSPATRAEISKRLADPGRPMATRMLYAGILASWDDPASQAFLLKRGREATELEQAKDVFWIIGHLDWLYPLAEQEIKDVNMRWAEEFMLEMLREAKWLDAPQWMGGTRSRQRLAISGFGGILAKMKSRELYPVLVNLWQQTPEGLDRRDVLRSFGTLADKRAVPWLLDALKARHGDEYRWAASALAAMGATEAIPILLDHLDDYSTYPALSKFQDERILPAVKKVLPSLKEYALGAARLMIIDLEGGDRLPKFIELAKDRKLRSMRDPMWSIRELKDPRAVPFAIHELKTSPDLLRRDAAICILAEIKDTPAAIKGLIDAMDIDFNALAGGKDVMHDQNQLFRERIASGLKQLTGQGLGVDKRKWQEYYRKAYETAK